jgi:hypothetical protein
MPPNSRGDLKMATTSRGHLKKMPRTLGSYEVKSASSGSSDEIIPVKISLLSFNDLVKIKKMSTVLIFEGIDSLLVGFTGSPCNAIGIPVLRIPILNQEKLKGDNK